MAWKSHVLVVASVTAASDDLVAALSRMAERQPTQFTLVVPATHSGDPAATLAHALERLQAAGLTVEGRLGDADPCIAVTEAHDPRQHDEIVVSTLPLGASKWLHAGLPERIGKLTGAPVTHVVSRPRPTTPETQPAPQHPESLGLLGPLLAPYGALPHSEPPTTPLR